MKASKKCRHKWIYRNPADRKCNKCKEHQQLFGGIGTTQYDKWEKMIPSTINAPNFYLMA